MEDYGERDRALAQLYLELVNAYRDNDYNGIIIAKSRVEKAERHKANQESHPLYSHRKGKVLSFADKINEMNDMYDDLIFELSDNSNETMRELKQFSAEEIIKFNKKVIEKLKRKSKSNM